MAGGRAKRKKKSTPLTKLKPLRDRVVVRRDEMREQKVGSIVVPDTAREKPQEARVVAVGPGRISEDGEVLDMTLEPGDRVLIGKWSGTEVTIDDLDYLILKEDEILCLLE